jgi:hypothetical protein
MARITDGGYDNVPNISSPEEAAVIQNISPAMEA